MASRVDGMVPAAVVLTRKSMSECPTVDTVLALAQTRMDFQAFPLDIVIQFGFDDK